MANKIDTYNLIKKGLDVASLRGKTISNNIANVNTSGYKPFKVVFEENFKDSSSLPIKKTNEKHIGIGNTEQVEVIRNESLSMNEDGNGVDLDVEKVNQAANTLKYNALITQANSKFSAMKTVIGGN